MAIQTGIANVEPNTTFGVKTAHLQFNSPFAQVPRVFLSAKVEPTIDSGTFAVTVGVISPSGCSFTITRCDLMLKPANMGYVQGIGWDQEVLVQWLAISDD
jgi:hypothetical protein